MPGATRAMRPPRIATSATASNDAAGSITRPPLTSRSNSGAAGCPDGRALAVPGRHSAAVEASRSRRVSMGAMLLLPQRREIGHREDAALVYHQRQTA